MHILRHNVHPVHIAIAYYANGTITGYRNGELYGSSYKKAEVQEYVSSAVITFGLRHLPADVSSNRYLKGKILKAQLYDVALSTYSAETLLCQGKLKSFLVILNVYRYIYIK